MAIKTIIRFLLITITCYSGIIVTCQPLHRRYVFGHILKNNDGNRLNDIIFFPDSPYVDQLPEGMKAILDLKDRNPPISPTPQDNKVEIFTNSKIDCAKLGYTDCDEFHKLINDIFGTPLETTTIANDFSFRSHPPKIVKALVG